MTRRPPSGTRRLVLAALLGAGLAAAMFWLADRQPHWRRLATASGGALFEVDADSTIEGWLNTSRPTLRVGCRQGHALEFVVETRLPAAVEPGDTRSVRYAFDDEEPVIVQWPQARNRQSLSAPPAEARRLAERLSRAAEFTFAYVPFNADPAVVTFPTRGFDAYWPELSRSCTGT